MAKTKHTPLSARAGGKRKRTRKPAPPTPAQSPVAEPVQEEQEQVSAQAPEPEPAPVAEPAPTQAPEPVAMAEPVPAVPTGPPAPAPAAPLPIFTHRSLIKTYDACQRMAFWNYLFGRGIQIGLSGENGDVPIIHPGGLSSKRRSLYLLTGSAFHIGMQTLLRDRDHHDADKAVEAASKLFWDDVSRYGVMTYNFDVGSAGMPNTGEADTSLDGDAPAAVEPYGLGVPEQDTADVMEWTANEQICLVEGMIRGWHHTRLPGLLRDWEFLEVEQERAFVLLNEHYLDTATTVARQGALHVDFQFTPDAVMRHRATSIVDVMSFKTASQWSWQTGLAYALDQQAISEVIGMSLASGVKVDGAHMEYIIKGRRVKDSRLGWKVTYSPLTRGWRSVSENQVTADVDAMYAWSWDVPKTKKDGTPYMGRLSSKQWQPMYVWQDYPGGAKAWFNQLANNEIQPECGNALEKLFFSPAESVHKQDWEQQSWLMQTRTKERRIRASERKLQAAMRAGDSAQFWRTLDEEFVQDTSNCVGWYGGLCSCHHLCHGPLDVRQDAIGSGLYVLRSPHHSEGVDSDGA